jgi:FAD/FMN-containing dehydrogenase
MSATWSRRDVLRTGVIAAGAAAVGLARPSQAAGASPSHFPSHIDVTTTEFKNWCGAIDVPGLWTARPTTPSEVADVVNWAFRHGWTVRGKGSMHGWSPLTVTRGTRAHSPVMLVDTTRLRHLELIPGDQVSVRAGAGATMLEILEFTEQRGFGFTSVPATGDPTIAGALAIGAHGAALPANGEHLLDGHSFGCISNLVTSLTAVVWDDTRGRYAPKTFTRDDPQIGPLLVHLGRTFLTEVTLRTGVNTPLRCVSYLDVDVSEMFAPAGSSGRTFASYVADAGRVEAIWFPFTDKPWLKVWSVAPVKPSTSRHTLGPYNYEFSDLIPGPAAYLAAEIVKGNTSVTPEFGQALYAAASAGLAALDASDLWGPSKDTLLYIRASTLRYDENGYGITCQRKDVQRVLHLFTSKYRDLVNHYRAAGEFPMNGPVEVRACGIDRPSDVGLPHAQPATLGSTSPRPDHPEWDTVVWLNLLTLPGTSGEYRFYREMEQWTLETFDGTWAAARPEWSKGWAFSDSAAWADDQTLHDVLPERVGAGKAHHRDFAWASQQFDALDPHGVYTNGFLKGFFGS